VAHPVVGAQEEDDCATSRTIGLLTDALEQIATLTTDAATRAIAEDALALFQGS
jgi:hypothetical protein